jgi:hypothetical protein
MPPQAIFFLFISGSCSFSLAVCQIAQTARIVGTETSLPAHIAGTLFVVCKSSKGAEAHETLRSNQRYLEQTECQNQNNSSLISRGVHVLLGNIDVSHGVKMELTNSLDLKCAASEHAMKLSST